MALSLMCWSEVAYALNYTGGSGDGYSSSLGATADVVTIASSTQTFSVDDSATAISTITISQEVGLAGSGINTTDDIRVTIPSALGMVWDTGDTTATIGGAASGKVSGTVTYEDAGKTLVVAVSADFVNGDSITISDLSFTTFTEVGSDNLDLEIDNAGTVAASDTGSKTINLPASPVTFTGGSGDGYSSAVFGGSNIYTWTGSSDASTWSDQGNWDIGDGSAGDDGYPDDAADKALINATAHSINTGGVLAVGELEISASFSGTVTLGGALTLDDSDVWDGDLRLSAGTLDTSGSNYQINIDGNWTKTGGTFTSQSGTVNFTKASGIQVLASGGTGAGDHFYHLTHSGAGTLLLSAAVVVNGNLTNSAGTLDVDSSGNYAITLGGNFANTATFSAQNGTVTLNGSGTSVISGSNTFYNLTSTTAAKNITFTAGTTQTINANLTLTGTGSNPVVLRSSVDTNKWNITFPNGAQSVTNVDVKDSDANTNTITCTGCVDSGNNNGNWNFVTGASITAPQDGKTVGITPTVIGTGLAGSTVNIKDKDGTTVATTTVDANGNFEVAVSTALAAGVNSLTPFVGASSGTTINLTIVSNPSSAQVPVVTSPESGSRVAGSKPTIVGQTQAGASVSIRAKDTAGNLLLQTVGSGTADGSGNYSITLTTALAAGTNTVVVVVDGVASDEYTLSLTDPFGVVFDSSTNELIEGATVTLYKTGGALAVPGVDIAATDENPQITGADGFYSFLTANNDYYFTIEALGYTYPSTAGSFPAGRTIVTGSKGETFTVAGVIIEMDHPMDSNGLQLLVEKDANKTDVTVGEVVTYTVTIENPSAVSAPNVFLEDRIPAGFKYIPGKAILDGVKISDPSGQRPVSFSVGTIGAGVTKTLKYQLVVGSGVVPGDYTNRAFARFSGGTVISNTANQTVKIVPDAVFDLGLAIGKVFWDRNEDGIQNNADERGLSFIKIVTEDGKVITTDKDGKFSIPAMKPGRHLLRLDERTLPEGSYLTTPKVVIIDVRPGLPLKANFGVNTNAKIIDESLSKVIMDVDRGRPVPRLSVTARCLKLTDQKQKENCPIEFNIHSNYSNFIEKWELEIIEKESGAVIKTFGGDVSTMDDPIYWEDYEKDKHYEHRLTVYGAKGRHDQTRAQKINFDIEDDDDFSVSENHLEQQSIFIGGETIKVRVPQEGSVVKVVRGEKEYASLEPARYNSDTEFTDVILPSGEYKVVRVENGKVSGRQDIKIGDDYLFFVAMGDAKMGYTTTTGNIEPAQPDDSFRDGFYNEGRLAYYLQGKIKGKYLITSSFDSDREEDDLFKTLEQEKYYPVYGDASSIDYKATDTQGKLYLLIQWDQNEALWGNYQTALNDTELAQFNRTLYGGRVKVKSLSETKDGEARTQVVVFGAEARQLSAHNEFLATGGSLFYVKHKDVIAGSEQVRVEVRDDITGLVISRHDMVNNRDYQFDYDAGRMVFYRPVESVVDSSSIISNALLNGNPVYVVVDYQYEVQDKLTNATAGARVEQALNDYLRVGGTYVEESQANEDYTLRGVDVELSNQSAGQSQGDFEGRLRLEYAESESEAQGNFISTDGGISFTELSTQDDSGGAAYSIEGDVRLFNRAGLRGYYKWIDKEFSTSSISSQQGKEMFGVSGVYDLSSRTQVRAGFDVQNLLDQGNLQTQLQVGAEKSTTTYLQVMHQIRKLKLTGEYRRQEVEQEDARFESENNQESDTVALRADYAVNEKLDVSLQQQVGDDNTQTTLGAEYRPNEQLALRVSETVGSDGTATQLGITNRINDRVDISGDYTLTNTSEKGVGQVASLSASAEVDEKTKATATVAGSSDHTSTMSFGTERKMSEDLTVKTDRSFVQSKDQTTTGENFSLVKNYKNQQWEGRFGQQVSNQEDQTSEANIYGLSGNVNDWLSLTGNYERGVVQHHSGEQSDRQAIALGVGMVHQDKVSGETLVKSSTKVEMRFDDGSNDIRQSFLYQLVEGKVSEDITVYAKAELSKTRNTTTEAVLERYKELEIGGAYRPVAHDRLNVLGSYTYLSEQSPGSQTDNADIEEERAHVLAGELIYDLSDRWQVAEKFAYRMGDEKVSGFGFTKTETWLQAHRLAYKIDERWKLAGEYRRLTQREAEDVNQGFLIEGIMRIDDSTEAGVGYNFTDFNDDLTDLDYTSQGPYVRVTGAFYDQTLDEIRRAKLKIEQGESARKLKKEKERHIEELNQKIKELRAEARDFDKSGNSVLAKSKRKEAKDLLKECRQAKKYLKLINKDVQREEEREAEPEFLKEARKLQAEGTELFEQGRYVQAEEKFKALLTLQEKVLAERAQREKQRQQEEKLKAQQIKKEREELRQIYKEALRLYRRKEYEQAQSQFKEIHVKAPDYKGTRRYLKRIEEKLKQQE